jgi:hypothetical protein
MKYLFVSLFGLLFGGAGAGAILYVNPLAEKSAPMPNATDRVLRYTLPDHVLEFAIGEDARILGHDLGDDSLWEETVDRSAALGLVLNDASGQPAALASRLMSTSSDTDLLLRGLIVNDHWLVTFPGEGTLFVQADSNAWPFLKETVVPVLVLQRPWSGPQEYWPTVGPGADSSGQVVGTAGAFAGSAGSAIERYELKVFDPARRLALAEGQIHLNLPGPQLAAQ